jgi:hypothetical protein
MEKPKDPEIDFPIDRINKFLSEHTFNISLLGMVDALSVKIELKRMTNYITVGEWQPYIVYDVYLVPGTQKQNIITSLFFGDPEKKIPYSINSKYQRFEISMKINELLRNFLSYWGIRHSVTADNYYNTVPYINNPQGLTESLILESKYDSVVRKVVSDIIHFVKYQQTGEFDLPGDISNDISYNFEQLENEFSVELNINEDDSVEDYIIDAEYYEDEDTIVVGIALNPEKRRESLQKMIGDLNETLMHEITHIRQSEKGMEFVDSSDLTPLEYYTQEHEIEAQFKGFRRRAKSEKRTLQDVMDEWFKKNKKLHRLKPKEIQIVKNKILGYSS